MSEIDTSASAIELDAIRHQHQKRCELTQKYGALHQFIGPGDEAHAAVSVLLQVIDKRDQQIAAVTADLATVIDNARITTAERNEANAKLVVYESCLSAVRKERPEVALVRESFAKYQWPNLYYFVHAEAKQHIQFLLAAIDDLERNEARWRNARDAWQVEVERYKARVAELEALLRDVATDMDSNVALAKIRAALAQPQAEQRKTDPAEWLERSGFTNVNREDL